MWRGPTEDCHNSQGTRAHDPQEEVEDTGLVQSGEYQAVGASWHEGELQRQGSQILSSGRQLSKGKQPQTGIWEFLAEHQRDNVSLWE